MSTRVCESHIEELALDWFEELECTCLQELDTKTGDRQ